MSLASASCASGAGAALRAGGSQQRRQAVVARTNFIVGNGAASSATGAGAASGGAPTVRRVAAVAGPGRHRSSRHRHPPLVSRCSPRHRHAFRTLVLEWLVGSGLLARHAHAASQYVTATPPAWGGGANGWTRCWARARGRAFATVCHILDVASNICQALSGGEDGAARRRARGSPRVRRRRRTGGELAGRARRRCALPGTKPIRLNLTPHDIQTTTRTNFEASWTYLPAFRTLAFCTAGPQGPASIVSAARGPGVLAPGLGRAGAPRLLHAPGRDKSARHVLNTHIEPSCLEL